MDLNMPHELDELINCSYCFRAFNESDAVPKLLNCRHYFCLKCVNSLLHEGGEEIYCLHCWKPTELPEPGRIDSLPNHNSIIFLRRNLHGLHVNAAAAAAAIAVNDEAPTTSARARANGGANSMALYERQRSTSITSNVSLGALSGHSSAQLQVNVPEVGVSNELATMNGGNNLCSNFQALLLSIGGGVEASTNNNQFNIGNLNFGERPQRNENCMTHAMPNSLWCSNCRQVLCRACATTDEHRTHTVKNAAEARDELHNDILNALHDMQRTLNEVQHMACRQRDFLLKILECATVLKRQIESELVSNVTTLEIADIRERLAKTRACLDMLDQQTPLEAHRLHMMIVREQERLHGRYHDMFLRIQLDDLVRNCNYVVDFEDIKRLLLHMHEHFVTNNGMCDVGGAIAAPPQNPVQQNHVLLLTNYCITQLCAQQTIMLKQQLCQPTTPFITNDLLSAMISNAKANLNGANNGGASVNFMHATYAQALQQHATNTNGSNQASPGAVGTTQQAQQQRQQLQQQPPPPPPQQQQQQQQQVPRRTYADIANSMPSTSAAAAAVQQQQQLVFSQQQQQQLSGSNSDNNSGSNSSNASGYGELAPIGTPPGGCSGSVNNNHHVITTRNVAAQLFSKSDFTSLDLSLLSFQQLNTHINNNNINNNNNNNMANIQQQLQQQQMSEPQQPIQQQQQHAQQQPQQHHPLQQQQQQQQQQHSRQRQHQQQQQQRQQQHHNQQQQHHHHHHQQHNHHHHQQHQQQKYRCEQAKSQQQHRQQIKSQKHQGSTPPVGLRLNPSQHLYPMYFFNVEINGQGAGTFVIEILNDIAPKMCKNFHALATHELGYGYKGCQIFQCWEKESIITGDFELNNGRGGRAVYEAGHFIPDETKIMAVRGCVGMRRTQKRHDNMGSVGSQFRIILREMRGFTGVFGRIVEGIDLIERIAQMGDSTGKPLSNMFITNCGKYVLN